MLDPDELRASRALAEAETAALCADYIAECLPDLTLVSAAQADELAHHYGLEARMPRSTVKLCVSRGVAGQVCVTGTVTYPGEDPCTVTFVGSCYGAPGPVVMCLGQTQTFVTDPGRYGDTFGEDWVRRFFEDATR